MQKKFFLPHAFQKISTQQLYTALTLLLWLAACGTNSDTNSISKDTEHKITQKNNRQRNIKELPVEVTIEPEIALANDNQFLLDFSIALKNKQRQEIKVHEFEAYLTIDDNDPIEMIMDTLRPVLVNNGCESIKMGCYLTQTENERFVSMIEKRKVVMRIECYAQKELVGRSREVVLKKRTGGEKLPESGRPKIEVCSKEYLETQPLD